MKTPNNIGDTLQQIREESGMTQAELAKRLPFTASRISRLESGELSLSVEEARQMATAIGSDKATAFADYLAMDWRVLNKPRFGHASQAALWAAETSLQRLDSLKDDPELKNAFLKQVESCRSALMREAHFLHSTEHPIAFIGSPGVGKTSVICCLAELRDSAEKNPNKQMTLQTGSGRTTLCEVHVRYGGAFAIRIDPYSEAEIQQQVAEFCDYLLRIGQDYSASESEEGAGISEEIARTLRNMTGLTIKKVRDAKGQNYREDPAKQLVAQFPAKEDLEVEVLSRLNLARRRKTSAIYPQDSTVGPLDWLSNTFAEINYGRHPEFSLPRKIEVSVVKPILGTQDFTLNLIDTRGVDEPAAPRRDLQSHLDDERAILVLCSKFNDAPDAAVQQAVIERATQGGLKAALLQRGLLLILPREREAEGMREPSTGESVMDAEEGRDIRRDQVKSTTLRNLGVADLRIKFFSLSNEADIEALRAVILGLVRELRAAAEGRIYHLTQTVSRLIENKANEQAKAIFEEALGPIRAWLHANPKVAGSPEPTEQQLLEEMQALRYASSLRASVNRRGNWPNFDYWHGLGFGARRSIVARSLTQLIKLQGVIESVIGNSDLTHAHEFITHFQKEAEREFAAFFVEIQQVGESAFAEQLLSDDDYWTQCRDRWGQGGGYKYDIKDWTNRWFKDRQTRAQFIEDETQRRWELTIERLKSPLMGEAAPQASDAAAKKETAC